MACSDKNHAEKCCTKLKNSHYPRDKCWTEKPENKELKECLDKKKSQNMSMRENNNESNCDDQSESQSSTWSQLHSTCI